MQGILEHIKRAQFFFGLGCQHADTPSSYRLKLAAIYSCRAVVDLMLESAKQGEVKGFDGLDEQARGKALEELISGEIPFYSLITRIRIHDFHRFGILPPNPAKLTMTFGGPAKLQTEKGSAAIAVGPEGARTAVTGASQVKQQRSLLNVDGSFFDEESSTVVDLDTVLSTFLNAAPAIVSDFEERAIQ
jgi:hypothetical protein